MLLLLALCGWAAAVGSSCSDADLIPSTIFNVADSYDPVLTYGSYGSAAPAVRSAQQGSLGSVPGLTLSSGTPPTAYDASLCQGTGFQGAGGVYWFKLSVVRPTQALTISSCGRGFGTDVSIFRGTCSDLTMVACGGDSPGPGDIAIFCGYENAAVTGLMLEEGEDYFIVVGGKNGATGIFDLNLEYSPPISPPGSESGLLGQVLQSIQEILQNIVQVCA